MLVWFDKKKVSRFTKSGSQFIQNPLEPGATFEKKWLSQKWLPVLNRLFFPLDTCECTPPPGFSRTLSKWLSSWVLRIHTLCIVHTHGHIFASWKIKAILLHQHLKPCCWQTQTQSQLHFNSKFKCLLKLNTYHEGHWFFWAKSCLFSNLF